MNDATKSHLKRLENAIWFANVGKPSTVHAVMNSWQSAVEHADSERWVEEIQGIVNIFCAHIDRVNYGRRRDFWNSLIDEISPTATVLVGEKVTPHIRHFKGKDSAQLSLVKIVRLSCMEWEYRDIVPLGYFHKLAELIINGRFPCGYNGEYPGGQQLVY